jgi:hypothetical protein
MKEGRESGLESTQNIGVATMWSLLVRGADSKRLYANRSCSVSEKSRHRTPEFVRRSNAYESLSDS